VGMFDYEGINGINLVNLMINWQGDGALRGGGGGGYPERIGQPVCQVLCL